MAKKPKTTSEPSKPKGRSPVPANETPRDKFIRLGKLRMAKALKSISVIGNLSAASYDFTQADVDAMSNSLRSMIEATFAKFQPRKAADKNQLGFDFPVATEARSD